MMKVVSKGAWTLKQLFPLTYRTTYAENDERHFCVWNMWMGCCFNIDDVIVHP